MADSIKLTLGIAGRSMQAVGSGLSSQHKRDRPLSSPGDYAHPLFWLAHNWSYRGEVNFKFLGDLLIAGVSR